MPDPTPGRSPLNWRRAPEFRDLDQPADGDPTPLLSDMNLAWLVLPFSMCIDVVVFLLLCTISLLRVCRSNGDAEWQPDVDEIQTSQR